MLPASYRQAATRRRHASGPATSGPVSGVGAERRVDPGMPWFLVASIAGGWTDMLLTRVGFGAWAIGGGGWAYAWGDQDDAESIAAIRHAVESGVNWIDTAAVYGLGHSEEVVAAALAGLPEADRPYVFTKGGLVGDPAARTRAPRRVGAPASLRAEVEASLRRLRVERIDLYQMHWPAEDGTPLEEYWQVFADLRREGKIRAAGLSNHGIL